MTQEDKAVIDSVEQLLAHIHAMKCESEDCLQNLADCLAQHNNSSAADIVMRTIELIQLSLKNIETMSKNMILPEIPPWKYLWNSQQQPDSLCLDQAHYLMTPIQALDLAIFNEIRIKEFCQQYAEPGVAESIRRIAIDLNSQEQHMITQMQSWREQLDEMDVNYKEDFDPPNTPE